MLKLSELKTQLTPYLFEKIATQIEKFPCESQALVQEAIMMSKAGVNSEQDHKSFFYILQHAKPIMQELAMDFLTPEQMAKVSHEIYENRKELPVDSILNFYRAAGNALKKNKIPIKKVAYPSGDVGIFTENPHSIQKWMQGMKEIYTLAQQGLEISKAFDNVTANWNNMEKQDFKHWLSFYEENAHKKYKTAQEAKYYQAGEGAMIPMDHLKGKLPMGPDMSGYNPAANNNAAAEDLRKKELDRKIKSIISRLNAAERLATDPEVQRKLQQMLDVGLPKWLEDLQRIKRLVQTAPLRATSAWDSLKIHEISQPVSDAMIKDLIIREGNKFNRDGKSGSALIMYKIAQAIPGITPLPSGSGAPDDSEMSGKDDGDTAIDELIEGMNHVKDEHDIQDINEIKDFDDDPIASIHVIAQALPAQPEDKTKIEVSDEPAQSPEDSKQPGFSGHDPFEAALANINVADVVSRLEALANIFRNREISRQLAIIDLMMDKLGIATYFPSLAEASSKSLESNQYALTRIEDILSKLRGSIEVPAHQQVELSGPAEPVAPVPSGINSNTVKQNLSNETAAEKVRKERRKEQEIAEESAAPTVTNAPQELAQPAQIQPGPVPAPNG